jgi:hypothetical protein
VKTKIAFKQRNRLEGQIAKAAQTGDLEGAMELARFGRRLAPIEKAVRTYLCQREALWKAFPTEAERKNKPIEFEHSRRRHEELTSNLCRLFLDAVIKRNGEPLRLAAKEIEAYSPDESPKDKKRWALLCLKAIQAHLGKPWTAKYLASTLIFNPQTKTSKASASPLAPEVQRVDSYSQLRRLAKSLGMPLAKDTIGKPQKTDK